MNDRELLEAAAKAEGHAYPWVLPAGFGERPWNPLQDDGDALRLAVALRLEMSWWRAAVLVETDDKKGSSGICTFGNDPQAATRRAIVRAASAIGGATGAGGE